MKSETLIVLLLTASISNHGHSFNATLKSSENDRSRLCKHVNDHMIRLSDVEGSTLSLDFTCWASEYGKELSFLQLLIWGESRDRLRIQDHLLSFKKIPYNGENLSPLLYSDNINLLRKYLELGASVNEHRIYPGAPETTLLILALGRRSFDFPTVRFLVEEAKVDVNRVQDGVYPLSAMSIVLNNLIFKSGYKFSWKDEDLFYYLIEHGADLNQLIDHETILHKLIWGLSTETDKEQQDRIKDLMRFAISKGADPNIRAEKQTNKTNAFEYVDRRFSSGFFGFFSQKREIIEILQEYE